MVAEQLPDNSELRVDVLLEGIESYRGMTTESVSLRERMKS
jgi:hypothetical protein